MSIVELLGLINDHPSIIIGIYIAAEALKALFNSKQNKLDSEDKRQHRVVQAVFDMLESSQEGLATEKVEILKLTDLLKRANFEVTILERKVSVLMTIIDSCILESPHAKIKFEESMKTFSEEIDNMRKIKNV